MPHIVYPIMKRQALCVAVGRYEARITVGAKKLSFIGVMAIRILIEVVGDYERKCVCETA